MAAHLPSSLKAAAQACRWLRASDGTSIQPEQARDLEQLVRALSERESLPALLDRVLDVLLLWTGAERGLLLQQRPDGELEPRSGRNLSQDDLGAEQLSVSTSLARRAIDRGEPVVAVDAMRELSSSYQSVHALKLRSVLALPLLAHGKVLGVAYLDDRARRGAFGPKELGWAQSVAPIAALAIADAQRQDELRKALGRAEHASRELERALAEKETALDVAQRELASRTHSRGTRFRYGEIVGESAAVRQMLQLVDRVATADVPVLLRGESGSGKELVARAIHRHSPRAKRPFVGENCSAVPETLLESTLFGHVRGAFTGALRPRVGLFEAAHGGTLFLDEIGEMSLSMQAKLLRILEDGLVRPVGSTDGRKVDVRVLAATHRDLEQMVEQEAFRKDLYYRLQVVEVRIPPLRERQDDVPLLVQHLLAKHGSDRKVEVRSEAMSALSAHDWPGNVRQLENEIRRALLLSGEVITVANLSFQPAEQPPTAELGLNVRARVDRLESELVREALECTGGNQSQAAKLLGLSRYGLHKMMKRLGIAPPPRRPG